LAVRRRLPRLPAGRPRRSAIPPASSRANIAACKLPRTIKAARSPGADRPHDFPDRRHVGRQTAQADHFRLEFLRPTGNRRCRHPRGILILNNHFMAQFSARPPPDKPIPRARWKHKLAIGSGAAILKGSGIDQHHAHDGGFPSGGRRNSNRMIIRSRLTTASPKRLRRTNSHSSPQCMAGRLKP
jgi:hypothetical protein